MEPAPFTCYPGNCLCLLLYLASHSVSLPCLCKCFLNSSFYFYPHCCCSGFRSLAYFFLKVVSNWFPFFWAKLWLKYMLQRDIFTMKSYKAFVSHGRLSLITVVLKYPMSIEPQVGCTTTQIPLPTRTGCLRCLWRWQVEEWFFYSFWNSFKIYLWSPIFWCQSCTLIIF